MDKARPPVQRYLSNHHYVFIDNALAENDELTAKQLKDLMAQKWADFEKHFTYNNKESKKVSKLLPGEKETGSVLDKALSIKPPLCFHR